MPEVDTEPTGLNFDRLPGTPLAELRRLWTEHIGIRTPPPRQKGVLIRELAWRVQERLYGGLDAETKGLLRAAMRGAAATLKARRAAQSAPGSATDSAVRSTSAPGVRARRSPPAAAALTESSRLLRTWRGRTHEVEVLAGGKGFRYRDRDFNSLSEIARLITGAHWSGPRFFGIVTRRKVKKDSQA